MCVSRTRVERVAEKRADTEQVEEVRSNVPCAQALGAVGQDEIDRKPGAEFDARDVLQLIRSRSAAAPLIVLADTLTDSQEAQFEEVTTTFRAQLFEKPARTLLLFNALSLGFAALRRPAA